MSDDKITISMDEVNHAAPVPSSTPPSIFTSDYVPPEADQDAKPKRTGFLVGIGIAAVALLCIICIGIAAIVGGDAAPPTHVSPKERTVADYRAKAVREIETELAKPDSMLKRRIENAHIPSVTVESTEIVRCSVTTVDGSEKAGVDDSNIDKLSMLLRFHWRGEILAGYTDLSIVYDVRNKRPMESKIDYTTDPMPTVEDFDAWFDIGVAIGALLAL